MAALATIRYPGIVRQQIFRPGLSLGAGYDAGWVEDAGRGQGEKARLHIQPKFCGKGARRWLKPLKPTGQARREQPELEACQSLPRPCTSLPLSVRSYPGPQSRVPPPPASSPLPMSADECAFRERRPNEPHSSSQDAGTEREMPSHVTPSRTPPPSTQTPAYAIASAPIIHCIPSWLISPLPSCPGSWASRRVQYCPTRYGVCGETIPCPPVPVDLSRPVRHLEAKSFRSSADSLMSADEMLVRM